MVRLIVMSFQYHLLGEMDRTKMRWNPLCVLFFCITLMHAVSSQSEPTSALPIPADSVPLTPDGAGNLTTTVEPTTNTPSSTSKVVMHGESQLLNTSEPTPDTTIETTSEAITTTIGGATEKPTLNTPEILPTPVDETATEDPGLTPPSLINDTLLTPAPPITPIDDTVLTPLPPNPTNAVTTGSPLATTGKQLPSSTTLEPDIGQVKETFPTTKITLIDTTPPPDVADRPPSTGTNGTVLNATKDVLSGNTSEANPLEKEEQCWLLDTTFQCKEPVMCYGSGNIDCDKENSTSNETTTDESPGDITVISGNLQDRQVLNSTCEMAGTIRCEPLPLLENCHGKSKCEPREMLYYTEENGLKDWVIVIIAVCATLAVFILAVLIYALFVSWKKLKVQPQQQQGISTVHYINHSNP